jgi:hypothetical protein
VKKGVALTQPYRVEKIPSFPSIECALANTNNISINFLISG